MKHNYLLLAMGAAFTVHAQGPELEHKLCRGGIYRHCRTNEEVLVVDICTDCDQDQQCVWYSFPDFHECKACPIAWFTGYEIVDGQKVSRFRLVAQPDDLEDGQEQPPLVDKKLKRNREEVSG